MKHASEAPCKAAGAKSASSVAIVQNVMNPSTQVQAPVLPVVAQQFPAVGPVAGHLMAAVASQQSIKRKAEEEAQLTVETKKVKPTTITTVAVASPPPSVAVVPPPLNHEATFTPILMPHTPEQVLIPPVEGIEKRPGIGKVYTIVPHSFDSCTA